MFLKHLELTTAHRPAYLPDEVNLFVQDGVGLYEGKFKIPTYQHGHIYLTTHRICYVDNEDPRKNSIAVELRDVDRYEFYAGFLKSSPKITLVPKPSKAPSRSGTPSRGPLKTSDFSRNQTSSPLTETAPVTSATWICPICSLSNPVPSNFDPYTATEHTPLPPCLACGIKPSLAVVLKAAIADAVGKTGQGASTIPEPLPPLRSKPDPRTKADRVLGIQSESERISPPTHPDDAVASNQCTRCTFSNHPTLHVCELCGAPLGTPNRPKNMQQYMDATSSSTLGTLYHPAADTNDLIKLSFREGGEKIFHERLKHCMTQRKWLLQGAPPVPKPSQAGQDSSGSTTPTGERMKTVGIAGLEERRLNIRKNNEIVIGSAFEDLEALMASAKEIVALAETFAASDGSGSSESNAVANALGLVTTKDMLGGGSTSESLYISELSRNLAEYLTDDATGVLRKSGGILTLVDLWAKFNRARGGVELVSPTDFEKAARLWEKLKLPVRLREFKSGVLVVQGSDRTDEKTIKSLLSWLGDFHFFPPDAEVLWDWQEFGRGITVQDAADRFGWSIGVAEEELLMAVEREALCREENPAGCRYWENRFLE